MIKILQQQVTWWISIILLVVSLATYVVTNFVSLDRRVTAAESNIEDIKNYIKEHNTVTSVQNESLREIKVYTKLVSDYFHLTPREGR